MIKIGLAIGLSFGLACGDNEPPPPCVDVCDATVAVCTRDGICRCPAQGSNAGLICEREMLPRP